jgi:hypothetical protein
MFSILLLSAAFALGQEGQPPPPEKPGEEPPAATIVVPAAEQPAPERPASASAPAPDRWLLMKALQGTWYGAALDDSRVSVSGWVESGVTVGTAGSNNLPLGFNYRDNNFSLQENWLRVERTVVTTGTTEPTFGFRSDTILPGTDYRFTVARGLFSDQLTADRGQPVIYGIDPVQFYAEAYFPTVAQGMDVKVGRFYAQYGAELIEAPGNALFSHSYTVVYDPFTHTGILTTTKLTSAWSVQAGLAIGEDVFFGPGEQPTFLGGVKWAPPNGPDSATLTTILDSARFDQKHGVNNLDLLDLIVTHKLDARLTYTLECLGGYQTNLPDIGTTTWLGVVNYFGCDFTSHLSGTTRFGFFNDPNGQRTGSRGLYTAVTAGLNYHPLKSVIFRPEIRYDYNDETAAFEGRHGLLTAAADLILRW